LFLNLYSKFEHEPEEGDCTTIWNFAAIFSVPVRNRHGFYAIALPAIPWQKLPILAWCRARNQTGKSTFIQLCAPLFTTIASLSGTMIGQPVQPLVAGEAAYLLRGIVY